MAEDRAFQADLTGAESLLRQALAIREKRFPVASGDCDGEGAAGRGAGVSEKTAEAEARLKEAVNAAEQMPFPLPAWQVAEANNAYNECLPAAGIPSTS